MIFLSNGGNEKPLNREQLDKILAAEDRAIATNDIKQKADGFTHRVTYWNHATGGDGEQADTYFGVDPRELTKDMDSEGAWSTWQEIKAASLGDYKIVEL